MSLGNCSFFNCTFEENAAESHGGDVYHYNAPIDVSASLVMPNPVWWLRVGGDLDIRIDDPSRFVMAQVTIELTGLSPVPAQTLEAMSLDLGAVKSGHEPGDQGLPDLRAVRDHRGPREQSRRHRHHQ
jgi:hypothetical protein